MTTKATTKPAAKKRTVRRTPLQSKRRAFWQYQDHLIASIGAAATIVAGTLSDFSNETVVIGNVLNVAKLLANRLTAELAAEKKRLGL
jgi:hypothetical protein